jgi:hypothetical protein
VVRPVQGGRDLPTTYQVLEVDDEHTSTHDHFTVAASSIEPSRRPAAPR